MAFNVLSQPTEDELHSVKLPVIFEIEDTTNTGEPKFRYVLRVKDGSTVLAVIKQTPNTNDIGVFDISHILLDYIEQTRVLAEGYTVIEAGNQTNQLLHLNQGDLVSFNIDLGVSYASDADSAPTVTYNDSDNVVIGMVIPGSARGLRDYGEEDRVWNPTSGAVATQPIASVSSAFGWLTERTQTSTNTTLFGSAKACTVQTLKNAPLPIAFLVGDNTAYDFGSRVGQLQVKVLDGALATQTATFIPGAGSEPGETYDNVNSDDEVLLYAGLGREQLVLQVDQGVNFNGAIGSAEAWEFRFYDTDGTTARSIVYQVEQLDERCMGGDTWQVYWRNRFGGIDCLPMRGKNTQSLEVTRETYRQIQGNTNTASSSTRFDYLATQGGTTVYRSESMRKLELMTTYLQEWDSILVESLVASREVWLYSSDLDGIVAATCDDKSVPFKRTATDGQFSYTLRFTLNHKQHA